MADQIPLFDAPPQRPLKYSLFLAIQPGPLMARGIHELAVGLQAARGLSRALRPASHLHVTLHYLGNFPEIPAQLICNIDRACRDAAGFALPFDIRFEQALSFHTRPGNHPFVLAGRNGANSELRKFHQFLGRALAIHGVRTAAQAQFNPHLTLQYTWDAVPAETIVPVQWRVEEFVLIRSEVGLTSYQHLGRWALRGKDSA